MFLHTFIKQYNKKIMIVPTMTYSEIANELGKDHQAVFAYANWLTSQNKYKRFAMKHPEPVNFKPVYWTSGRKNNYVIIPSSEGKNFMKKNGISYTIFCYYFGEKNSLNAVMVNQQERYNFYSSHLFDRYGERFLNDTSMNKVELMVEFAKNNSRYTITTFDTAVKYKNSIFGRVNEGIIIGCEEEGFHVFKTFLTEDMLKGSEIEYNIDTLNRLERTSYIDWVKAQEKKTLYSKLAMTG